ncbi:MAG TPA: type II toxin-antitoxin system VapB family antitoxin [Terriglobales bacterium]|nr:type II toxin-antitoxin system VapB family antitoxin [Terriglobales bacterium]
MLITLILDNDLLRLAQELSGVEDKTALVHEALKALVARESARRLAKLGGSMPDLSDVVRRDERSE